MKRAVQRAAFGLLLAVLVVYLLFPFYYAVVTSFTSGSQIFEVHYWPPALDFGNYLRVFGEQPFGRNILNSLLVATVVVGLSLLLGLTAAFALARIRFRGRGPLLLAILATSMFPQVAVLSGLFELIRALGLFNNPLGLMLSYLIFTLPFTVWVLTAFIRDLPVEIEEAALLDGAGPLTLVFRVFLPMLWPAMVATGLLAFIVAWNEFLFALTFTLSNTQRTVPVAIALISGGSEHELPWGNVMAASVTVTVPLIVLVLVFQRRLVAGMTAGAVKG
ncbi:MAG TPA: sugar ABC transporter permease [Gammaproteobacteria bacterium]|nr:sugar ABC transporter permease [Gammaproteobacteria bacterium]HCZ49013.1 sugar ABC transporter permease [Gammaproteobacteria bacterium]MCH78451.1 sugar ABC transporter permease [Gammaproteobacteria bacterium]